MKKELYIKRGLKHGNIALNNIIDNEILQSKSLKGIGKEIKRLEKANDYLSKGFDNGDTTKGARKKEGK
jgi:hypothetical protein